MEFRDFTYTIIGGGGEVVGETGEVVGEEKEVGGSRKFASIEAFTSNAIREGFGRLLEVIKPEIKYQVWTK